MLKHGLKFLWLSKITMRFCQHCGGSQLVSEQSEKTCFEMMESCSSQRHSARLTCLTTWVGHSHIWALLRSSLLAFCAIDSCPPSLQGQGGFGDQMGLGRGWWRRDRRKEQSSFGIEEPSLIQHWMVVGTIICIHLCHPGLSVGTFHNCFCNSRLTFQREKKLPTGLRIKVWLL